MQVASYERGNLAKVVVVCAGNVDGMVVYAPPPSTDHRRADPSLTVRDSLFSPLYYMKAEYGLLLCIYKIWYYAG